MFVGTSETLALAGVKLPSTTQTSTAQTTQANTATVINKETGFVDVSKNPDFGIVDDGGGTNSVYQGVDKATGQVKYIGITERAPDIRFGEHLNSIGTGKDLLQYRVIDGMENLSRINARILEQSLINQVGKSNLLNIRNSIAPKYWFQYGIKP